MCCAVGVEVDVELAARRGGSLSRVQHMNDSDPLQPCTYGRKLQLEVGRLATSVNISEIRRCWTEVSYQRVSSVSGAPYPRDLPAAYRIWSGEAGPSY